MFGIGGGIVIVPALVLLANFPTKTALGTSLGALLLPVGLLGAYAYWENGQPRRPGLAARSPSGSRSVWPSGARLAQSLPAPLLQRLFAVFIMVLAVRLWLEAGSA